MKKSLTLLLILSLIQSAFAQDLADVLEGESFTVHIRDQKTGEDYIYNSKRAKERFTSFSTFKIPNSVIALETDAVKSASEKFEYDPMRHRSPYRKDAAYNRDQTLTTAFKASVVWTFQEIAQRVGRKNYDTYLKKFRYGNLNTSGSIERFWLDRLKISATEQVSFLSRLYQNEFKLKASTVKAVKNMMLLETGASYRIYGKTGTGRREGTKCTGWLVGYVETEKKVYVFALNADSESYVDLKTRRMHILRESLDHLGVSTSEPK